MNLLIVDDEYDIVNGIVQSIDFETLGFENVYTAQTAARARQIIEQNSVDILLTDIEMPGESGLDLLLWVRDSRREIVTLFCTSYANFDYAQKAIELHSFDYYLKPIDYSTLTQRIQAAAAEVMRIREAQNLQKYGSIWLSSLEEYKFSFWHRAISGAVSGGSALSRLSVESSLPYNKADRFTVSIIMLDDQQELIEPWKKYAFKNLANEVFAGSSISLESFVPLTHFTWCVIFRESANTDENVFLKLFSTLSLHTVLHLSAHATLFYSMHCTLDNLHTHYSIVQDCFGDDVGERHTAVNVLRYQKKQIAYTPPDLSSWTALLTAGKSDLLTREISRLLDGLFSRHMLNLSYLKSIQIDTLQMMHNVLNARQIDPHTLWSDKHFETLRDYALLSATHMTHFLAYAARTAARCIAQAEHTRSAVGQVKSYIRTHLSEKITRTGMAKLVFMNADYLARIFKKETGQSLGAYLQDQRIEEAKRLLMQTDLHIYEISQGVGYDNFSYFTCIFRQKTGMTPNEYRREYGALQ